MSPSLEELLDAIAERTPAPGGGSTAAWACALAAALVQMAGRFMDDGGRKAAIAGRAGELRSEALELAERELHAYEPVLEALRLPRDDPDRARRIDEARSGAAQSPLELARIGCEVAELGCDVARDGNPHLEGDAVAGALIAEAACRAAARLVEINLSDVAEDARVGEARELATRAAAARERALG